MKKISFKETPIFWIYITIGALAILGSIILAPFWQGTNVPFNSWGAALVNITMGVTICAYLILYLSKKLRNKSNSKIHLLTIIEFVVLAIIAVCSFFVNQPCLILGIILWSRGSIEVARAYSYKGSGASYPAWYLIVAIGMITFGTYIIANPLFTALHVHWVIVGSLFILGALLIFYGIKVKPKAKK